MPFEVVARAEEVESPSPGRCLYLVVGPLDDPLPNRLAQTSPVVAIADTHHPSPITHHPSLGEQRFEIKSIPTAGGYLVKLEGDLIGPAFYLLARGEEYVVRERDQHDRFQWAYTTLRPPELAARPVVSEYAHLLLAAMKQACICAGISTVQKEFWPGGRPMAACLTHDVDVVKRGRLPRGVAARDVAGVVSSVACGRLRAAGRQAASIARTAARGQDPYWTFHQIAGLERDHGYRSTYFFMAGHHHPEDAAYDLSRPPVGRLAMGLADSGCEVALHGSYASYTDPRSLQAQKERLERLLGEPVAGHRNHLLRFRVPDSWRAHEAAGFSYDSTLGFADREGFRGGHAFPFHPFDLGGSRTLDLLEIPVAVMDMTLQKYRRLRPEEAERATVAVLEQTRAVGGLANLLWHNTAFYDVEYPGLGDLYRRALEWLSAEHAHVATCREIDGWWRARAALRLSPLPADEDGWRMEAPLQIDGLVLRVWPSDPGATPRVKGEIPVALRRHGPDYLLEFGRIPAGSTTEIECS